MASPSKIMKRDGGNVEDSITGYVHSVSPVKVGVRSGSKYFKAILQCSREEYRDVIVYAMEKRVSFVQAEKNRSPVKLARIKRVVSCGGGDFDIQCGRHSEMYVNEHLGFQFKEPPENVRKTVAEVKVMAPRQEVGLMEVNVCHVKAGTEMVQMRGEQVEMQTCQVQDSSGRIQLNIWDTQIGRLVCGQSYQLKNLSTREYFGLQYVTTTSRTEIIDIDNVAGTSTHGVSEIQEEPSETLCGVISRAEIKVSRRCVHCHASQREFNTVCKFHRCERCKFLQKAENYQPTSSGRLVLLKGLEEVDLSITHSVLMKYLTKAGLGNLLVEGQNVEEHLLSEEAWRITRQSNAVVAIERVLRNECGAAVGGGAAVEVERPVEEEVASATEAFEMYGK